MAFHETRTLLRMSRRALSLLGSCALIATSMIGCSTPIPGVSAIAPTANPSEEVSALSSDVESARAADLDVLSPTWFGAASDSLAKSEKLLAAGGAVESILRNVAEGRAALDQARTFATLSQEALPAVIKARQDARSAGAAELGDAYARPEEKFLELTSAVESGSLNWARRTAPEVEKTFRRVELSAIKNQTAARIRDLIVKAKTAGAERFAPIALADVESRYAGLDKFIAENRYASEAIGQRAEDVLFYANRLVHLTEEAKHVKGESPESLALENEALLVAIAQKLELPDLRNQSQRAQKRQIENTIDKLQGTRHDLQASVDRLNSELETREGKIAALKSEADRERTRLVSLEAERKLNQRFAEVSAQFKPGEAEVYKKGSQLVIRVRSIDFPVGSSVILPGSYPVLAKVQKAISQFEQPRVVVEGHTDSTGSAEVNDRISQERADAVLAYFTNNQTIDASRISAVGKGFSEPLASDRTAEGRAENRRIDVLIDAGSEQRGKLPAVAAGPSD